MDAKVIAPNTAPGENADKPRKAFFWGQYWVARPSMPDQAVYDALKVTQEPKNRAPGAYSVKMAHMPTAATTTEIRSARPRAKGDIFGF